MATLSDVAKAAQVSVATASMVLNPGKQPCRVRPECADKVRAAALRLGYHANYHARAMQLGKADTIGFALDIGAVGAEIERAPLGVPYFAQLVAGVEARTHFMGHNLALIGPGASERAVDSGVRQIQQRRIDGLVVAGVVSSARTNRVLVDQPHLPLVLIEYDAPTALTVVHYDEAAGVARAVEHLAGLGHRRLLWLGPDKPGPRRREAMCQAAAQAAGLRVESCLFDEDAGPGRPGSDRLADLAQEALAAHLPRAGLFTGAICYNDSCAIGAYGALLAAGRRIPGDVSVVGYDDVHAAHLYPRLASVSHLLYEMGQRAAELVLEMAADPQALERLRGHREVLVPHLVVRESTAPRPA